MKIEAYRSLVDRAKNGDREATEGVLLLLEISIGINASYLSKASGIPREDLMQEGRLGAIIALEQVDTSIGDPISFLALRAKWAILTATRNSQRHPFLTLADDYENYIPEANNRCAIFPISSPDDPTEQAIVSQLIHTILGKISYGKRRKIFQLLILGCSQSEIAEIMNESSANLSYHVRKIRAIVNEEFQL